MSSSLKAYESNSFSTVRNFQTEQQGVLIGILNQYYDIYIEPPKKKSIVSIPFLKIIKLQNEKETVWINEKVMELSKKLYLEDIQNKVKDKTATRRFDVNRIVEHLKILVEMCRRYGYEISLTNIGKKRVRENIESITFDGVVIVTEQLKNVGNKINDVLVKERMNETNINGLYCLKKQDLEVMGCLFV